RWSASRAPLGTSKCGSRPERPTARSMTRWPLLGIPWQSTSYSLAATACSSARTSSPLHAGQRGESFTGRGKRPLLTPAQQVDRLTGLTVRTWVRRMSPISGKVDLGIVISPCSTTQQVQVIGVFRRNLWLLHRRGERGGSGTSRNHKHYSV